MPYILDNWHALQLPEQMWRTPVNERREKILTALQSSRKRFKCGREMKKRATIWGLRFRRPPPPPHQLQALEQIKKGDSLSDELVRSHASRLRFLPRAPSPAPSPASPASPASRSSPAPSEPQDSSQPSSSNSDKSSYKNHNQRMIVPVDGHWLNLMMGKRFHENLNSNSNSENDSTSSYESIKAVEAEERPSPSPAPSALPALCGNAARKSDAKDDNLEKISELKTENIEAKPSCEKPPVPSLNTSLVPCSVKLDKLLNNEVDDKSNSSINFNTHSTRIATMNLEVSKLSTKNIIEHSKIMSLQHMDRLPPYGGGFNHELESSGDETSSRGTLDAIIPPLKDFQGKNNPFLMQNSYSSKKPFKSAMNGHNKLNGKQNHFHSRLSLPVQLNPMMGPVMRPLKRKLSEKDIVIGPNGEVKRRKYRRPRKYLQMQQLNKSCPLPDESKPVQTQNENGDVAAQSGHNAKFHGRRLRQRQEKNYYENARRNTNNNATINSVKSLQLSPHKSNNGSVETDPEQLSALKSRVQSYFRAGQTFRVLARRHSAAAPAAPCAPPAPPAYLIEWDPAT
ncbi:hypothetical protein O0L34_g12551 [Tuta absoluta]|nr:hypothetical protein O0L34_g12551 [Tuta absoluta]